VDIAVGSDDQTRILWSSPSQGTAIWDVSSSLAFESASVYGAISGWLPVALSAGNDGTLRVLWDANNGAAALWVLADNGNFENAGVFGPF
jgi:hypothetical protein